MFADRAIIHAICTLHGQWLPGDRRGFRSRDHKVHSSGDYKNPPPPDEHEGLRRWAQSHIKGAPSFLLADQLASIGLAFLWKLDAMDLFPRILSSGCTHLHVLFDAPPGMVDVMPMLGRAKQYASLKLADHQGQLWAEGAKIIRTRDIQHARNVFGYIRDHAIKEGAWIWRYDRDPPPERPR